jgi:hypothetical protein
MRSSPQWLAALLLTLVTAGAAGAQPNPDVVLTGELNGQDNHAWRALPFDVPPGTTRITVEFDYTGRDQRTALDIGLLGPDGFRGQDGFRGWSGGDKHSFTISATDATPSYLPGPIRSGRWSLILGVPSIRPNTGATYTVTVRFEQQSGGKPGSSAVVLRDEAGWYRGDLHMHTAHSDGSCLSHRHKEVPCPLFLTAQTASERGLDFIAISDHNTTSHAQAVRELQPFFDDLLIVQAREVTTYEGHANLFGVPVMQDFRVGSADVPDWNSMLAQIAQANGVLSINHPIRPSGEECMGCGWTPKGPIDYHRIQAVEIVNGLDGDTRYSGIPFWEKLLNQGYHLTGVGGSDNHNALKPAPNAADLPARHPGIEPTAAQLAALEQASGTIGTPTTVVYADALSEAAIVSALRRGRVFVDLAGTRDRKLDVTARAGNQVAHMGEELPVPKGGKVRVEGVVDALVGGEIGIILDGKRVGLLRDPRVGSQSQPFAFEWRSDGHLHWIRVDVRDERARLALVGNPIYLQVR